MTVSFDTIKLDRFGPGDVDARMPVWETLFDELGPGSLAGHPRWLRVLRDGLKQDPYCIEASAEDRCIGILPLALLRSRLFGRFLVSLPYINTAGVMATESSIEVQLLDQAIELANKTDVRYLELRHEMPIAHPALNHELTSKVHMRLALPDSTEALWKSLKPKVRNQIRKGEQHDLRIAWGGEERLDDFYRVFSHNMRDLGTPVFGRRLFLSLLRNFPGAAELCTVHLGGKPIAAALLTHGSRVTDVQSASTLRQYNATNANMLMYWHLLCRTIERGNRIFDFGRSSEGSGTYRFKKQWGAQPEPAVWQYYVRKGSVETMRPENARNQRLIRVWKRLPVPLTRLIGPMIVRGIP